MELITAVKNYGASPCNITEEKEICLSKDSVDPCKYQTRMTVVMNFMVQALEEKHNR